MGRPTKLPEVERELVELLGTGAPIETCAAAVGISKVTLYTWLDLGLAGREPYAEFLNAASRARARAEIRLLRIVACEDGEGEPELDPDAPRPDAMKLLEKLLTRRGERARGAAWILERTRPQQYASRINVTVRAAVSEVMEVVRELCAAEDFERVCERLANRDREGGDAIPAALPNGEALDS